MKATLKRPVRFAVYAITGACLFASGIGASTILSPKGRFSTMLYDLEYDPSHACSKPYKPFSSDRFALEQYRNDAIEYMSCMKRAAASDVEYASEVIADGYKEKAEEFLDEVRSR